MELLLLGIGIMALGATLVHLAVEDRKAALAPVAATRMLPRLPLLSMMDRIESTFRPMSIGGGHTKPVEFGRTDVLLADALTELLELKEQVTQLQARIDELESDGRAARHLPRPIRRRLSQAV